MAWWWRIETPTNILNSIQFFFLISSKLLFSQAMFLMAFHPVGLLWRGLIDNGADNTVKWFWSEDLLRHGGDLRSGKNPSLSSKRESEHSYMASGAYSINSKRVSRRVAWTDQLVARLSEPTALFCGPIVDWRPSSATANGQWWHLYLKLVFLCLIYKYTHSHTVHKFSSSQPLIFTFYLSSGN